MLAALLANRFSRSLSANGFARFTTMVSVASVALGCLALVVAMSVLRGYEEAITTTARRFGAPIELRSLTARYIGPLSAIPATLAEIEGIDGIRPTLTREALGRSKRGIEGLLMVSVPTNGDTADQHAMVIRGRLPQHDTGRMQEAAIGYALADRLRLDLGDTMVVYTTDPGTSTTPTVIPTRIGGILRSGMERYDDAALVLPFRSMVRHLNVPDDAANVVGIRLSDGADEDSVANHLADALGPAVLVQTSKDRFATMYAWIALQREPIPIVLGLISIVAMFTVVAALLIAAVEKTRSVAILRSMGMPSSTIAAVFVLYGLRIGAMGSIAGCALAFGVCFLQHTYGIIGLDGAIYYVNTLPVSLSPIPYLIVIGTSVVLCTLASLVPVLIAARIQPVRVLQFH